MERSPTRPERILVVDDDPDIARFVQVHLEFAGFRDVVLAGEPSEALEHVDRIHFDLVITGVMMPRMDGREFVRILRDRPDTADTPIMFLTAQSWPEAIAEGYAAGANDYMTKPFDPIELIAHVKQLLGD